MRHFFSIEAIETGDSDSEAQARKAIPLLAPECGLGNFLSKHMHLLMALASHASGDGG